MTRDTVKIPDNLEAQGGEQKPTSDPAEEHDSATEQCESMLDVVVEDAG